MSKAAVFTMKLEADLRSDFVAAAEASHRPASQVVRELMREFVNRQDHKSFLQSKVDASRISVQKGRGRPHHEVEADFAARRARITDQA